jgi:uncharacterized membrane protein YeaQ/YmgE (transglycosylase-associated protein family)
MITGLIWWIIIGLIAGWLAGKIMKGSGYGTIADIVLGMVIDFFNSGGDAGRSRAGVAGA